MANKVCDNACLRALLPMETWEESLTTINETLRNEYRLFIGAYGRIVADPGRIEPTHSEYISREIPCFSVIYQILFQIFSVINVKYWFNLKVSGKSRR